MKTRLVDKAPSKERLNAGKYFPETPGFAIDIRDLVTRTNNYNKRIEEI